MASFARLVRDGSETPEGLYAVLAARVSMPDL